MTDLLTEAKEAAGRAVTVTASAPVLWCNVRRERRSPKIEENKFTKLGRTVETGFSLNRWPPESHLSPQRQWDRGEMLPWLSRMIGTINHDALYEYQGDVFFRERPIQRKTPQRIVLKPDFEGDMRKHLPRKQLESGEFVKNRHGDVFALGATLRNRLKQNAERIKADVAGLVLTEMEFEEALARNDEVILRWEKWRTPQFSAVFTAWDST